MIVKVCGMRDSQNIHEVARAGADLMGMIFYDKSPRLVSAVPDIPKGLRRVGVFVNSTIDNIIVKVNDYDLDMVQLHGNESPEYIRALRSAFSSAVHRNIKIIKAISINNEEDIKQCENYGDCIDIFLFDTRCPTMGGSGKQFDWSILDCYHGTHPFLLSGGICPDDAPRIAAIHHPMMIGIDLNSRFETSPAMKDAETIKQFIEYIKQQ